MYEGKHLNKNAAPKRKKAVVLLVSLLVLCFTVAGTMAFLTTSSGPLANIFTSSTVKTEITEDITNNVKSNVKVKNTGDITAYIRAAVVITWQDADGNVYGKAPVAGTDYNITWTTDPDWQKGADGFYYYKKPVDAGDSTKQLFTGCSPIAGMAPEGYSLTVEIIGSGIQSVPASAVVDAWGSDVVTNVAADGTLTIN